MGENGEGIAVVYLMHMFSDSISTVPVKKGLCSLLDTFKSFSWKDKRISVEAKGYFHGSRLLLP